MSAHATDTSITSDTTIHTAQWNPDADGDGHGRWIVSWLPQRTLSRYTAGTAIMLAELVAAEQHTSPEGAVLLRRWSAELHITPDAAVTAITHTATPQSPPQ